MAPTRRIADAPRRLALPLPERVLAARPWATPAELGPLAGVADGAAWADAQCADGRAANVGGWIVSPAVRDAVREQAVATVVAATDPAGVDLAALASQCGIDAPKLRAALAGEPRLVVDRDVVRSATSAPVVDDPAARALLDAMNARPFDPPAPTELGASPTLVRALIRAGELVDVDGVVFARARLRGCARTRRARGRRARRAHRLGRARPVGLEPQVRGPVAHALRRRGSDAPARRRTHPGRASRPVGTAPVVVAVFSRAGAGGGVRSR